MEEDLKRLVTSLESKYPTLLKTTQNEKLKMTTTMTSLEHLYVNQSNVVNSKSFIK